MPKVWSGDKGSVAWSEFAHSVYVYASALDNIGDPRVILDHVVKAFPHLPPTRDDIEAMADEPTLQCSQSGFFDKAIYNMLSTVTSGSAGLMVRQADAGNGLRAWRALSKWYNPVSVLDRTSSLTRVMHPGMVKDVAGLHNAIEQWEIKMAEHESRFSAPIGEDHKMLLCSA